MAGTNGSTMRLQRYLAQCGVASRRASEALIEAGRVSVNGQRAELGVSVVPGHDEVLLDGAPVGLGEPVYILLNKPRGMVTTMADTHNRPTVLDCLRGLDERVFPVGRLDLDVDGALLLTNDGSLAHRLMHPSYEIDKVYRVRVKGQVQPQALRRLQEGVELEDGVTAPAQVRVLAQDRRSTLLELTLHEGKKREVKRMCAVVEHPVIRLTRTAVGPIELGNLKSGKWRRLTAAEEAALKDLAEAAETKSAQPEG